MISKIWDKITHPHGVFLGIIYTLALSFFILFAFHTLMGEKVVFTFSLTGQLISIEIGGKITEIPANIEVVHGKMLVNGVPIRDWLESQGYTVIWDNEAQAAIATPGK